MNDTEQLKRAVERRVNNMTEYNAKKLLKALLYKEVTSKHKYKQIFNFFLTGLLVVSFVYAVQH